MAALAGNLDHLPAWLEPGIAGGDGDGGTDRARLGFANRTTGLANQKHHHTIRSVILSAGDESILGFDPVREALLDEKVQRPVDCVRRGLMPVRLGKSLDQLIGPNRFVRGGKREQNLPTLRREPCAALRTKPLGASQCLLSARCVIVVRIGKDRCVGDHHWLHHWSPCRRSLPELHGPVSTTTGALVLDPWRVPPHLARIGNSFWSTAMDGGIDLRARDGSPAVMDNHFMPFTPNREFHRDPKLFARAEGVWYYDTTGRKILDGSSGLFTTPAGHGRKEIAKAVYDQMLELDFTPSFLRGHPKAYELATRIAKLTPDGLDRIFFASSGSEAVDTAMKLALAYHRARGQGQRQIFVSRERAYHGVNFGGVALSGMVNNRRAYGSALPNAVHMRHTHIPENRFQQGEGDHGADLADDLIRIASMVGPENIAAVFVEPIAGSTGTLVPPKNYLKKLREICDTHGILLVFDEVITGFGRTGKAFAAQSFGITPDLITMAKAITNGTQPMSAIAVKRGIHDTLMESAPDGAIEFFHGYTWSAHPAACAASLATLDIYDKENLFERANQMSAYFLDQLWTLQDLPIVTDIRGYGMMGGFDVAPMGSPGKRGHALQAKLFDAGVHIKTTGDAVVVAPPFVMEAGHIDQLVDTFRRVLKTM